MVKTLELLAGFHAVLGFESYYEQDFVNVHLIRIPRSWAGSVQIKSSMTLIRGNRCIERER